MKVRFKDIGRNKVSWDAECNSNDDVFKELKKHLMSDDIECVTQDFDGLDRLYKVYKVYVGFRLVGSFEIDIEDHLLKKDLTS